MLRRTAVLLGLLVAVSSANAAEIKCLCPVAMRALLGELGPQFERASGHKLTIEFARSRSPTAIRLAAVPPASISPA
jgi:ABC-type molybdate transport system substrate-binding protein